MLYSRRSCHTKGNGCYLFSTPSFIVPEPRTTCHSNKISTHYTPLGLRSRSLSSFETSTISLSLMPAACNDSLTLLWRTGPSLFTSKSDAQVKWFVIASHEIFSGNRKSFREAVLCFVKLEEFAKAPAMLGLRPGGDARGSGGRGGDASDSFLCAVRHETR
ncbi:hypothetical protein DL96DRAFT_234231 [Flagelloscypha sp. PMI_526]|nr:hypothetical protein DL96DRAFT_234231 [Flagelloscypha sp. PMI_526]